MQNFIVLNVVNISANCLIVNIAVALMRHSTLQQFQPAAAAAGRDRRHLEKLYATSTSLELKWERFTVCCLLLASVFSQGRVWCNGVVLIAANQPAAIFNVQEPCL